MRFTKQPDISIGLEHLSSEDSVLAKACIAEQHPEHLFRRGYSLVNDIAACVRRHDSVIWTHTAPRFISFYGTPLADTALGLVRGRPLLYEGIVNPGSSLYRDFESLVDVKAAANAVECLIAADILLFECAAFNLPELEDTYLQSGAINDQAELTMLSLLATMLIAQSLHADTRLPLLDSNDVSMFAAQAVKIAGQNKSPGLELFADQALVWLETDIVKGAIDQNVLQILVRDCLAPLQEMLDTSEETDHLRYASAVLVKRG